MVAEVEGAEEEATLLVPVTWCVQSLSRQNCSSLNSIVPSGRSGMKLSAMA